MSTSTKPKPTPKPTPKPNDPTGWSIPVVRGVQAGREHFVGMVRLRDLARLIQPVDPKTLPEYRAQRAPTVSRFAKIARYMCDNPQSYIFDSLAAEIDGLPEFRPAVAGANVGTLEIPFDMRVTSLNGNHRRGGIVAALTDAKGRRAGFADETVSVCFYIHVGMELAQGRFEDLNCHSVRVAGSLRDLYNQRDPHAALARAVVRQVPEFAALMEGEKAACSGRSGKLFAFGAIRQATQALVAQTTGGPQRAEQVAVMFWTAVVLAIKPWRDAANDQVPAFRLRQEYVHAHAVGVHAIGLAGAAILREKNWAELVARLGTIDWRRASGAWEGRALTAGQMSKSAANVRLTANAIKKALGLELSVTDQTYENALGRADVRTPVDDGGDEEVGKGQADPLAAE